jgi:hypothetical protein
MYNQVLLSSGIPIGNRPENHYQIMGTNEQPSLPNDAILFLQHNINSDCIGFEFGCGSSTFWFAKLSKYVYSVESDKAWYDEVNSKCLSNGITNVQVFNVVCEMKYTFENDSEIGGNYDTYSDCISNIDTLFDYIVVDGVARSLCIKKSIEKLKSGWYLIIDNAERPAYWDAMSYIPKTWELIEFSNHLDTTKIFKKP